MLYFFQFSFSLNQLIYAFSFHSIRVMCTNSMSLCERAGADGEQYRLLVEWLYQAVTTDGRAICLRQKEQRRGRRITTALNAIQTLGHGAISAHRE